MQPYSLLIRDRLYEFSSPIVMAIINITPDSFAVACRSMQEEEILEAAARAIREGATILDLGGYSTRPGATEVTADEEWARIARAGEAIRRQWPEVILSIDTFRREVAERAYREGFCDIVNDISGYQDPTMPAFLASARVPYILTHMRGTPATMMQQCDYQDLMAEVTDYLVDRIDRLQQHGVRDLIIDPGFGFAKTTEQNFELLNKLDWLQALNKPVLAGISRKSMIYRTLGCTAGEALNGTTALHMAALERGAAILRAHDVREAQETIRLYEALHNH